MRTEAAPGHQLVAPGDLPAEVDLLVIGGGITGAGVALEAARRGVGVLLVDAQDFAGGTSSASSKLVHGGLRYLSRGGLRLARESLRERAALLAAAPGLVEPQAFVLPAYAGRRPSRRAAGLGLALYDLLAGARTRRWLPADELLLHAPHLARDGLFGGWRYLEARTDDARLVLRVLDEAQSHGARLRNHCRVDGLLRDAAGQVCGASLRDARSQCVHAVRARCVVNATGAGADTLRAQLGAPPLLRPLRGSHLMLPLWRLPLAHAVAFMHPADGRPVFAYPWEGAALVGTTDVDHRDGSGPPLATATEIDYLLAALQAQFPSLDLSRADLVSAWAGVRPVVAGGNADPSKEARDMLLRDDQGLLTVSGGKLTTFRPMAVAALKLAAPALAMLAPARDAPLFAAVVPPHALGAIGAIGAIGADAARRLLGRHGRHTAALLAAAQPGELDAVPGTPTLLAELRWAARAEAVCSLDDLLLRRVRIGLVLPNGAASLLPQLRAIVQPELGWDDATWQAQETRYRTVVAQHLAVPVGNSSAAMPA